jgi:hypothetical protein
MKKRQESDLSFERENLTNMLFGFIQRISLINQVFFFYTFPATLFLYFG